MPRIRVWAREQNLSKRVLATCLSWVRAVLLISCVLMVFFSYVFDGARAGPWRGRSRYRLPCLGGLCLRGRWGCTRGRRVPSIIVGRREASGWYFSIFLVSLSWQLRSMHTPNSKRRRNKSLRSKKAGSVEGSTGTPRT